MYRARLALLSQDYESLRERYGTLVRETAVTELVVRNGALSVSIRTAQGKPVSLPTQLDPSARSTGAGTRTRARLLARRACLSTACSPPDPERSSLVLPPL
ncbi:MAG: hypothetical protein GY725_22955 [bacterium]|nr:hypothetical protein [bacterium]